MNKRKRKKAEILSTAIKLFCEKGYVSTTINDISSALSINQASVYYYFHDKQEILYDAMYYSLRLLLNKSKKIVKQNIPPNEKLEHLIKDYINQYSNGKGIYPTFNSDLLNLNPDNLRRFTAKKIEYENIFRKVIDEGIASGYFSRSDYELTALFILALLHSLSRWFNSGVGSSLEEVYDAIRDFIYNGIVR